MRQDERKDEAKMEWLCAAAKEGFDDIERGDFIVLHTREDIDAFMSEIHAEVFAEFATDGGRS